MMLDSNPFAVAGASLPAGFLQGFLVVMALAMVAGTLFDIVHKGSAKYFFANMRKAKGKGRALGGGERVSIAVQTAVVDVLASGEFCNQKRRIAHLLGMYGFVLYVVATAVMVFGYPTGATPAIWPALWWIGALMVLVGGYWFWFFIRVDVAAEGQSPFRLAKADLFVLYVATTFIMVFNPAASGLVAQLWWIGAAMICVGGYWFWFFIRVDVAAEGHSPLRVVHADLFILSLLVSVTLGLIWAAVQASGASGAGLLFGLYVIATTVLFGSVPWSKFAHMFFKPAAAFEKRLSKANGTAENLPTLSRDDPEQRQRHSMELLRDAPMDMGLGIKREAPRHY